MNVYGLSSQIFNVVRGMANTVDWSDSFFIDFLAKAVMVCISCQLPFFTNHTQDFRKEMIVVGDHAKLKDWVHPLHYRKTGSVLGAGRRLSNALKELIPTVEDLTQTVGNERSPSTTSDPCLTKFQQGKNFTPEDRRALFENVKEIMTYFLLFINCCEMVVSTDFNAEVNELARSMKDVVDTASGKMQFIFDDVSRICITSAIRVQIPLVI